MVDVVRMKPLEQVRGRPFPKRRSGDLRVFQPEGEFPLQTRCRSSEASFMRQPEGVKIRKPASHARFRPEPKDLSHRQESVPGNKWRPGEPSECA